MRTKIIDRAPRNEKESIFRKLKKNWVNEKRFGLFRFAISMALLVINKFCHFEVWEVYVLSHHDSNRSSLADKEVEVRRLNYEELCCLATDERYNLNISIEEKVFQKKDHCFGVILKGEVANYRWYTSEKIPQDHAGVRLSFPKKFVYAYKGYTLPEYRGRGFQVINGLSASNELSSQGVDIISIVNFTNWANKRSLWKQRARSHGYIYNVSILDHDIKIVTKGIKKLGIYVS